VEEVEGGIREVVEEGTPEVVAPMESRLVAPGPIVHSTARRVRSVATALRCEGRFRIESRIGSPAHS
jgi:hypothetical protein